MTQQTVHTRFDWSHVRKIIDNLPRAAAKGSVGREMMMRAANVLLGKIREAFVAKSKGKTDEAGDRWAPLKPETVAYGRKELRGKRETRRQSRPSQALTIKQQERWWELYRQGLAIFDGDKGRAAQRAWVIVKREGGKTLLSKHGGQKVDILNKSGQLLESLTLGSNSRHQILRAYGETVHIGTKRPGAMAHHRGSKKRGLPQRKLWPDPNRWPHSWWQAVLAEVRKGVVEHLTKAVKSQ